jgi:hypothetical protein
LTVAGGIIFAVAGVSTGSGGGLFVGILSGLGVVVAGFLIIAFGELIQLLMDIEENTRESKIN